ncbi:MAG: hypothetical protein WC365_04100, partial [Candidatus Babeliales bacterium]
MKKHLLTLFLFALCGTHTLEAHDKKPADANKPLAPVAALTQPTSATTVKAALSKEEVQQLAALLAEKEEVTSWFARNKKHLLIETTLCVVSLAMAILWYLHVRQLCQRYNKQITDQVVANDAQAVLSGEVGSQRDALQVQIAEREQQLQAANAQQQGAAAEKQALTQELEIAKQTLRTEVTKIEKAAAQQLQARNGYEQQLEHQLKIVKAQQEDATNRAQAFSSELEKAKEAYQALQTQLAHQQQKSSTQQAEI